jgi:hypothetical protein
MHNLFLSVVQSYQLYPVNSMIHWLYQGDRQLNYYNLIRNIVTKFVSMSLNDRNALNVYVEYY